MVLLPGVSKEQIEKAREVEILDYVLAHEPDNVKRVGNEYRLKDHSVTMSNGKWHWQSRGIGGATATALNYLIKVRGYSFVDAVRHLNGDTAIYTDIVPKPRKQPERQAMTLPPRSRDYTRVVAYLQRRGIDKVLILDCIKRGLLYESAKNHNCVFIGRDETGRARFAAMRGINSDFKRDADGSDKRFGFALPPASRNSDTVAVFESPIDALSHASLFPDFDGWRLSLDGTSLVALMSFLERHSGVKNCIVCTDADKAGELAAAKIAGISGITVTRSPPLSGKDWNQALLIWKELKPLEDKRKDIIFRDSDTYKEMFHIKDGDSIKLTLAFDGEEVVRKCRWIDEVHLYVGSTSYHIDEFATVMARNGNKYEPVPPGEPMLDIIAAKYGEPLKDAVVPMTEAAIRKLVGGDYTSEVLRNFDGKYTFGALLRGKVGMAVCGLGDDGKTLTSLHPYNAQMYKRELATDPPIHDAPALKESLRDKLDRGKEKAAQQTPSVPKGRSTAELE